ncbi:hypothetical protein [Haloparvum sp. AD34]
MADQWLCVIHDPNVAGGDRDQIEKTMQDMQDDIESRTAYSVNTYFAGEHSVDITNYDDETEYIKAVLRWLENNGYIVEGDNWLITHYKESFGWGRNICAWEQGVDTSHCHGNTVYAAADDLQNDVFQRNMARHEVGHGLGPDHSDGCYKLDSYDQIYGIRPMGSSYTYNKDNECDTEGLTAIQCGSGSVPDNFACGKPNYQYTFIGESYRWHDEMADPAMDQIVNNNNSTDDSLLGDCSY